MYRALGVVTVIASALLASACWGHKEQFHTILTNNTGGPLHSIEVDYPGGSYGISSLPAGESNHKWVFVKGSCEYTVHFVDQQGRQYSPKPIQVAKGACPPGVQITIDAAMHVTAGPSTTPQ